MSREECSDRESEDDRVTKPVGCKICAWRSYSREGDLEWSLGHALGSSS